MPHIHEKIDYAADAYIVEGNAVLLRLHEKYHTWFPPGGHVELDEDPEEAALREVQEEVGLSVTLVGERAPTYDDNEKEVLVPRFINRHAINDTHEHISFVYFAKADTREFVQGETEVSDHIRWFTREELADPTYGVLERVQHYARAALDALA
ncbi:NUDIX domain-containing protein [Patescibacteria group bacterium]|nr:NUDIX domain-containing protein [Patescibacteria group bacterium]